MIVATSVVCHRAMTYGQSPSFIHWSSGSLLPAVLVETAYHIMWDEQMVHELSFVFLIIVVAIKTRYLIKLRVHNSKDKEMLQKAVIFGAGRSPPMVVFRGLLCLIC
jgi:dihydroceramidase